MTRSQEFPQPVAGTVVPRFGDVDTFMRLPLFRDPSEVEIGMVGEIGRASCRERV